MICNNCLKECPNTIIYKIIDKNGSTCICPNCSVMMIANNELILENDESMICEVTGKAGAVTFISENEKYVLRKDIMLRLLAHNLDPYEYVKIKNNHEGFCYMIHEDFYDEDGFALQPIL